MTAGALPPGLLLNPGTGTISGNPTGVGNSNFTITVTDAAEATASSPYSIAIASAPPVVIAFNPAGGALKPAMASEAYAAGITTTANAANTPIFTISAGSLPGGVTLNVSTGELTGPLSAATEGDYSFTISVTDGAGGAGQASYTLNVAARAVTVEDKTETVPAGSKPPNVDLNAGATGGPFTEAYVGTVEPANAGTATIIHGDHAAAGPPVGPLRFYLKFTPTLGFTGTARVGYRLVSALGTSNTGTVTYTIAVDAAAAAAEVDRSVRSFVAARQNLLSSTVKTPGLIERRRMGQTRDGIATRVAPASEGAMMLGAGTSMAELRAARSEGTAAAQAFNIWIDGTLMAHRRDRSDGEWGSFGLLSAGADHLVSPRFLIGFSAHFDRMTDPTDTGIELSGDGWLAGPYASLELGRGAFFDTKLLYGSSSNDIDSPFFRGSFETTRWMGSATVSGQWQADDQTTVTPHVRAIYFNEEVEDYGVANAAGDLLLLEGFTEKQIRISLGADFERYYALQSGLLLVPSLGASAGVATLDNSGLFGTLSAGLRLSDGDRWDLGGELLFSLEGDGEIAAGGKLGGSLRF